MNTPLRTLLSALLCPLLALRSLAAPVANPDFFDALEDTPLAVPAAGVLANDVADPDSLPNAVLTAGPAHGAFGLNLDGSFTYAPAANYSGPDSFQYQVIGTRNFVVDRARSTLNVKARATIALGTDEDDDNGKVVGNVQVFLNPAAPPLQQIQIQDLTVTLDERVDLHLSWLFGLATLDARIEPGGLVIDMDRAGPPVALGVGGTFAQPGNEFDATGTVFLTGSGLAGTVAIPPTIDLNAQNQPYDIAPIAGEPALGAPQLTQVGGNFELRVPIKIVQTFTEPDYTVVVTVKGTIVATAPVLPTPVSAPTTVTLNVLPVDDLPTPGNDRYYTRQNFLISIPGSAPETVQELIPAGAVWRYAAGPNDLGTGWRAWNYPDAAWLSGPAPLGYGDAFVMTPIDDGPDANRYPTYYFRREFTLTAPFDTVQPSFEILRDDAAAVYVNGVEVYRDSEPFAVGGPAPLPPAPAEITYQTLSAATIPVENVFRAAEPFSRSVLFEGRNVIAVEVHQQGSGGVVTSGDVSFDLRLRRTRGVSGLLANDTDLEGDALTTALFKAPTRGVAVVQANGAFSYNPSAGFTGTDTFLYRVVQNGVNVSTESVAVPFDSTWRYLDDGSNQGTAWRALAFNDAAWKTGDAELGYGDQDETTLVEDDPEPGYTQPASGPRFITTYFRHAFNVTDRDTVESLSLRYVRDDGLAVYVNGQRVWLDNLAANAAFNQGADNSISGADESAVLSSTNLSASMLVEGQNVVAVEVHQADTGSSDMSFNLELTLRRAVAGRVTIEVLDDDIDNDLVSDTWERANGIDYTLANANDDLDSDGESNRHEFLAGTDPRAPGSLFRVRDLTRQTNGSLRLTLQSVPGKRYQLQLSSDLAVWANLGTPVVGTPASESTLINLPSPTQPKQFFRVQLQENWQ